MAAIERAMHFDMSDVLTRYKFHHSVTDAEVREHERELKRFLTLCALNPDARYGMLNPVDNLWHEFIIFTKKYVEFCELVAGKYIHHKSRIPGKSRGEEEVKKMFNQFRRDYFAHFGEPAPEKYWKPSFECSHGNCGNDPDNQ